MSGPVRVDVKFLRSLVEGGAYVWANPDREPLDDQNPTDEAIAEGLVIAVLRETKGER